MTGYIAWVRDHPPPDLQQTIEAFGGYDKVTPDAWAAYDKAMAKWLELYRSRHVDEQISPERFRARRRV
jgi:hypothetical protein